MRDMGSNNSQIYERLWIAAVPLSPSVEGSSEDGLQFERRALEFATAAVMHLGEDFLEAELIAAGVAVRDEDGELIPAPALCGERIELIALRARPGELPYETLTPAGCLRSAAAAAMLRDFRVRGRLADAHGYVYLATKWLDAMWLERAGLAAIYCPGVEALSVPLVVDLAVELATLVESSEPSGNSPAAGVAADGGAVRVESDVDIDSTGSIAGKNGTDPLIECLPDVGREADPDDEEPSPELLELGYGAGDWQDECAALGPALVVVAWSPSAWSPGAWRSDATPELEAQLDHLAKAQTIIPLAFPEVIIWSPRAEDLERLELLGSFGDGGQRRQAIAESVETAGRMLRSAAAPAHVESYSATRAAYLSALDSEADDVELAMLKARYDRCRRRDVIDPVLQHGERMNHPLQRAFCVALAETCDLMLQAAPAAATACGDSSARGRFLDRGDAGAAVRRFMGLAKTAASLRRALP